MVVTFVMVLGGFAAMVSTPGTTTAVSNRGESTRAGDFLGEQVLDEQASGLQMATHSELEESERPSLVAGDDAVAGPVEPNRVEVIDIVSTDTRSPGVDAGGPYGGPTTYEGAIITFTATVDDPALMFFRWDFDEDGTWDTGWIFAPGMSCTVDHVYYDDFYGNVIVEAWDGFSIYTVVFSGDHLSEATPYWYISPYTWWNIGWKFIPKYDYDIVKLGKWRGYYDYGYEVVLWDVASKQPVRYCSIPYVYNGWRWCSITPYTVTTGQEYIIAARTYYTSRARDYTDFTLPDYDVVEDMLYYIYSSGRTFPANTANLHVLNLVDFEVYGSITLPITESDDASVEVNNIAPTAWGVASVEPYGMEGSPVNLYGIFEDPGTADDWWYRFDWGDGTVSGWREITKMQGGARVLVLHAYQMGRFGSVLDDIEARCGSFCIAWDVWDYGPVNGFQVPELDYMLNYDVILIGTDYFVYEAANTVGDRLADFMDAGGNVVAMTFAYSYANPNGNGIGGRFVDDEYMPVTKSTSQAFSYANLGTIYTPGHPVFDGVGSLRGVYRSAFASTTSGSTRIADWTDGNILAAERTNPIVPNDAISFFFNLCPYTGYFSGDVTQFIANAIKYASRNPPPTVRTMPITLDPMSHIFADDNPSTTPYDTYEVTLEVKDDDHGRVIVSSADTIYTTGFSSYPSDWDIDTAQWRWGYFGQINSYCLENHYYYGAGIGAATSPSFDMSAYNGAAFGFRHYWQANWAGGNQDGWVQASTDGGLTWPYTFISFHHNEPPTELATYEPIAVPIGTGQTDVRFRFLVDQNNDWYWRVDDIIIQGLVGFTVQGLGSATGTVIIYNVEPKASGGPTSGYTTEGATMTFKGYTIDDPALWEETEWFAYRWDMDDGTTQPWHYVGSMAPPQLKILLIHSQYESTMQGVRNWFLEVDLLVEVELWDIYTRILPTASYMAQFDMCWFVINRGAFDAGWAVMMARFGDNIADYMDLGGSFVNTFPGLATNNQEIWRIRGRYITDGYTPVEIASDSYGPSRQLGEVFYPDHMLMEEVNDIASSWGASGTDHTPTIGGNNNAAGVDGYIVADWNTGGTAIAAKELLNGARTVYIGQYMASAPTYLTGSDWQRLVRNAVAWCWRGVVPTPKLPDFNYVFGDNGVYNVDLMMIDDDMGWTWDHTNNVPMASPPWTPTMSHSFVPISIDNVDPLLSPESIEVFIAADFCLRVTGESWHKVALTTFMDGAVFGSVEVVRQPGDPNEQAKCTMLRIDLMTAHDFAYEVTFDPFMDPDLKGSNPTWVIISPHKEPITPGHGTVTHKYDFNAKDDPSTWTMSVDLPTIKQDLLDSGHGAKIGFSATAYDPGTDDLAFLWIWGDSTPYGINVHHNMDFSVTEGVNTDPENVGFSEPWFDFGANDWRSSLGNTHFTVTDEAYHGFVPGYYYYVVVIVMDDDVNDPYPSLYGHPGIDMEFIDLDLR